ncbi:uncharacterized protein LACBIDRAFT_317469 [Laccaria bicolor S238N-H82]|uniref:Predicted protein n=1 Tax=Laccaria bicolor (strain S238N-H82 / ATCC MYA-4686) TaxID=486041 RepID=B0E1U1_LACBS|nr:uncharacterized protein LACBIDRAFT_317469 [Laccaria bicolor S238N-H82]EDQ99183.1 predicted protein [Laccaria bicolor S238N-H82]|eukprot:XP_001890150.1 predicted protein [Laccaria bicolor S238N-H82]
MQEVQSERFTMLVMVAILSMRTKFTFQTTLFAGPVQSGFLPRKQATMDRNRSRTDPDIEGTEPNHLGPVFCGPWTVFKPIQTGFFV